MPDRELRYKGYKIKLAPKQRGWRIRARHAVIEME